MYKVFILSCLSLLLTACATEVPRSQLAASDEESTAKQFNTAADSSNLYFVWPPIYQAGNYRGLKLYINNDYIGSLLENEFLNIQTSPGKYSIRIDAYAAERYDWEDWTLTTFDLTVAPNSLGIIECYGLGYSRTEPTLFMTTEEQCSDEGNNNVIDDNGITYCPKSGNNKYSGGNYFFEKGLICQLSNNKSQIRNTNMVAAKVNRIENNGDNEYQQAVATNTASAYQSFMQSYPTSSHYPAAESKYTAIKSSQEADALTQRINKQLALDEALPLTAKKDKYMVALTSQLNQQQYEDSLFYFELLERLNVQMPASFDYFWGEALLRTNKPKQSLEKLYSYINSAGSTGKYYTKALELSNEAQAKL